MEHREAEMMDSSQVILTRLAHFLTPTSPQPPSPPPASPHINPCRREFGLRSLGYMLRFRDYFAGDGRWKRWARKLHREYEMRWKDAGIYETIGSSAYETLTDADVIIAVAEKWCSETNTFMFPWGEATVTLEDVNVLGGFSLLGVSVNTPEQENSEAEQALNEAFWDICTRDCHVPRTQQWMERFEGQQFEHEAFITLWLSRFVFPSLMCDSVNKHVIPIAIRLAEGHRVALAPAVLAGVYQALTTLKNRLLKLREGKVLKIYEPLYLVQLWVWERFVALRPRPNILNRYDVPRVALWKNVRRLRKKQNVRLALDTAGESFVWRPYMFSSNGWLVHPLFKDEEQWFSIDYVSGHGDRDIDTFARCLRACEIVGFGGSVQKYLPNRVARQFGFDQDVPGCLCWESGLPEDAWTNYSKPLVNTLIFVPPKNSKICVTKRYRDWWKKSVVSQLDQIQGVVRRPRSLRNTRKRCYEKGGQEADFMDLDGLTPKHALYYLEWSEKAQLLRQEPEEMDEGAERFINTNDVIFDKVLRIKAKEESEHGVYFGNRKVAHYQNGEAENEVLKGRIIELEAVNKKLVGRITELEMVVGLLRSEYVLGKHINVIDDAV